MDEEQYDDEKLPTDVHWPPCGHQWDNYSMKSLIPNYKIGDKRTGLVMIGHQIDNNELNCFLRIVLSLMNKSLGIDRQASEPKDGGSLMTVLRFLDLIHHEPYPFKINNNNK